MDSGHSLERRSYRKVYRRLWANPEFRSLVDGERVIALYVLAGPQTNRIGLFKFSLAMAAEDLGRPMNTVRRQLAHVITVFGWQIDHVARVIWIPSWWKYNPPPKQRDNFRGALTDLNDVPRTALMSQFFSNLTDIPEGHADLVAAWQSRSSAPPTGSPEGGATETETETETYTTPDDLAPVGAGGEGAGLQSKSPSRRLQRSGENPLRDRFERFWVEYPRKIGKDAAWREWLKRSPGEDLTDQMIASIRRQRASAQWQKDGGQFIPHPRTWLHQGRWQDELEAAPLLAPTVTPQARRVAEKYPRLGVAK